MPAMSRGPPAVRAPKKRKGGTESSRNHTWKGFSQRITELKIEPVRRGRSTILDDAELGAAFSYFHDAFLEWRELNLSETFSAFARKAAPLCDSLPQVLHHSDRLMELLVEHMQKNDRYAEEPLLSLLAHLAHDLGERFEKHFEAAVRTVAHLAATHADVEVIEWAFSCLAWLFKYLSRLLVPDLRPVFDLMAPLLGKDRQKAYVSRFAAESLTFLIRKAGASHHRDKAPLQRIIQHMSLHIEAAGGLPKQHDFQNGIMYLLADSLKGPQRGFHSSAPVILQEMLVQMYSVEKASPLEPVVVGVLTACIHHTDAESFELLLQVLHERVTATSLGIQHVAMSSRLLFVVCGVRQGSRIADWKPLLTLVEQLFKNAQNLHSADLEVVWAVLPLIAISFQYCPLNAVIPHEKLLESLVDDPWAPFFLSFCDYFAEIGLERFKTLLLPYFKRFVHQKAHERPSELCLLLPRFLEDRIISSNSLEPSRKWHQDLDNPFNELLSSSTDDSSPHQLTHRCNAYLNAINAMKISEDQKKKIRYNLEALLYRSLKLGEARLDQPVDVFATGVGFQFLIEDPHFSSSMAAEWPALCQASEYCGQSLSFWRAMLGLLKAEKHQIAMEGEHLGTLRTSLHRSLQSPSHDLRLTALHIMQLIVSDNEDLQHVLSVAVLVEQTPLTLEHQRSISMRVGQIAKIYPSVCNHDWLGEAVPSFCFGLLHVRLASVWDDTITALKSICGTKEGEMYVTKVAFDWLSPPSQTDYDIPQTPPGTTARPYVSEFECTNVVSLGTALYRVQDHSHDIEDNLETMFQGQHVKLPYVNTFSRTQALRLLNALPQVAEKRSRHLVPILLAWALDDDRHDVQDDELQVDSTKKASARWARKDQKAMLSIFANFVNPKVLYRADEVRAALLALLGNGDVEIQKTALQALLSWKNSAVTAYKEELLGLLDDARFRDELPVFLSEGEIQDADAQEILPIVLRLLYGRVVAGKRGLEAKRKAVFIGLKNRFGDDAIRQFLAIAFGPLHGISIVKDGDLDQGILDRELTDTRKQVGVMNMLDDLLSTFNSTFTPFTSSVVDPVLYCLFTSSRQLSSLASYIATNSVDVVAFDDKSQNMKVSLLKTVRQRALHILAKLFESNPSFAWADYVAGIVAEVIQPRLDNLPIQTAQSVSGLLRLFSAWATSIETALFLVKHNKSILSKIIECLDVASAKDEVKKFVLDDVLARIIGLLDADSSVLRPRSEQTHIQSAIIDPYSTEILSTLGALLHQSPSKDVLESSVQVVARLAPHVTGSTESRSMIEIATFLLRQPSKRVGPRTKLDLLRVLHEFIQRYDSQGLDDLFDNIFDATCPMFAFVQDRNARTLLCLIVQDLARARAELSVIAEHCHDLNSFSKSRLDEPDFDRRSRAFNKINGQGYQSFTLTQWKPLMYNMLYFIKDNDELSIRANASMSLSRLVEVSVGEDLRAFLADGILPGIQNGMKEPSELVRAEFLAVLEQLVKVQSAWPPIADLHSLLSEEEESSFFSNVLHIQGHRRIRALRRLAACAASLKSGNIYHIILPLLEHFVFNKADDDGADSLSGETIKTLTALVEWMEWPQLRSLLKRYIGYLTSKEDMQKPIIKLIVGLMEALNRAGSAKGYITAAVAGKQNDHPPSHDNPEDSMVIDGPTSELMKTLPKQEKLTADLTSHFLPQLTEYLHKKDETTVSLRVPVAIAITKVLLVLPPNEIEARLPGVLLDICYILKSRAPEARDMSRNTLTELATFMGPEYLSFILKALRTALQRGYQLHVLSYTLHYILVKLNDQLKPGDLDYCLEDIVNVIMDDTFGITGQEKDAEEYISKMKEVKSSKSFDSMDIISRAATPAYLIKLILPIRSLLMEKVNARMVQKIDELLRRIGLGFLQNPTINDRDILVFCYELIQDVYQATATSDKSKPDHKMKRYLVNMRGAAKSGARLSTSSYTYKLIRFSMDILRTVLRKHADLQTPQNLAGFLPVIGDAMVQGQEEVQVAAVRLLTTIIKVPMPELDTNCPVYIDEAVRAIKGAPTSNTELAQASLKLVSAVLRDRPNVDVKERDAGHLIKRMVQDLDEPDRQGVSFGFLKAVMNRRMDIPEVYEAMDKVAEMMITNQTKSARDVARSHYFQFLTTYTHSEKRFKKQIELLLKNLRYEHMEGRLSVMEALDLIMTKALPNFPDKTQYDYHGLVFLPLINCLANDDSSKCREMASLLIKRLFQRASDRRLQSFVADFRQWLEQDENMGLRRLGIQCWGFYFEAKDDDDELPREVPYVLNQLDAIIDESLARRDEDDWEQIYYALTLLSKVLRNYPGALYTSSRESLWTAIEASAAYPHMWVKQKAAELTGTYFAHLAVVNKDVGLGNLPLIGQGGLQLADQNMVHMANMFVNNLLNQEITEQLCTQSVKNIAFLARCFAANGAKWHSQRAEVTEDDALIEKATAANLSDGGEDDELEASSQTDPAPPNAIHRLMIRLSGLVRRDNRSMLAKSTTMQLLETIYTKFPLGPLESSLPHVLSTLNTLVDPATTIPRAHTDTNTLNEPNEQYKALIYKAREIMNALQKRMGTQEYLNIIGQVQKDIRDRREERRRKRKVEAVANPEAAEKEKRRRHDVKRVKRKERGLEQRGKRRGW